MDMFEAVKVKYVYKDEYVYIQLERKRNSMLNIVILKFLIEKISINLMRNFILD